ncbi:Glycine betaine ABC transport system permease protein [Mycetocola reblochoni REB411]|uniref:Glycine betaine ABC transport system permease protein n=1 Tax=Mycetocola reblochoni REB411 TaxID=1255698 RepID=A0A1R4IJ36_9MICO|nr:Glycine betaine ABC transport system permease protein [Mycetocola reblochoni REB411]
MFLEGIAWLFSPDRLSGPNPLPERLAEHLGYTLLALVIAAVIAVPLGYLIGHTGRGRDLAVGLSGAARALPSLGLLFVLTLLVGIGDAPVAATIVFVVLGIPPILAGAYAGFESVDRRVVDAARSVGMTPLQVALRVEAPLGLPLLIAGVRSAALQIVSTAVLAAYVNLGGLGIYLQRGIQLRSYDEMIGGAIVVVLLAFAIDGFFALLQRLCTPAGVRVAGGAAQTTRGRRHRRPATPRGAAQ